jgi:hypothetical protein
LKPQKLSVFIPKDEAPSIRGGWRRKTLETTTYLESLAVREVIHGLVGDPALRTTIIA